MHNPDVSHDVSQSPTTAALSRPAQIACGKGCGLRLTTVTLRWTSHSKPWTTRSSNHSGTPEKPVKSMILVGQATTLGVSWGLRGFVQHVCKHHLHQAQHTMKGGECGGDSYEDQRRPVDAVHFTQHRLSSPRRGRTRARVPGLSDPDRRRLCAGLHPTPPRTAGTSRAGR